MIYDNAEKLKEKLKEIKFGILKISGTPFLKLPKSIFVETCQVDEDGHLWCLTSDIFPAAGTSGKSLTVHLKYVHKPEGLFIKVTGHATAAGDSLTSDQEFFRKNKIVRPENTFLLKVKIDEIHFYKKKSISGYTSFLQAIKIFTFNKAVLDSGL